MTRKTLFPLLFVLFTLPTWAQRALILYDGQPNRSEAFIVSHYIENLLGHFTLSGVDVLPLSAYRPGTLKGKDFLFVASCDRKTRFSSSLLRDLARSRSPLFWINHNVDQFLALSPTLPITFEKTVTAQGSQVFYKATDFPQEGPLINLIKVRDPKRVTVWSTLKEKSGSFRPYIVQSGRFWYVVDSPFSFSEEGGRNLIFADLLHDFLGQNHPASRNALIRLEDINPDEEPEGFRRVIEYLHDQKIPFQISFIPIYRDPALQYEVLLSERPEILQLLQKAQGMGGTLVMHGVTHQYRGSSGDDYEFWDEAAGRPISNDSPEWLDQRLQSGLDELSRHGLIPLAWETPHYSAAQQDYPVFKKYFTTLNERVMATDFEGTQQLFPYTVRLRGSGLFIVPENCGFIDENKPEPQKVLDAARRMLTVRDGIASFFFHPFVDIRHLQTIVKGMRKQGWNFISLRDFPCTYRYENQWATTVSGKASLNLAKEYLRERTYAPDGKLRKEVLSPNRLIGKLERTASLSKGELYLLQSLPILPPHPPSFWERVKSRWLTHKAKSSVREPLLKANRTLLLKVKPRGEEERNDQESLFSVFSIYGFNPEVQTLGTRKRLTFQGYDIIVVPNPAAQQLMKVEINSLLEFVENGGLLVTDGRTPLAESLGLGFEERKVTVREVKDLTVPSRNIRWNPAVQINPAYSSGAIVNCQSSVKGIPLAMTQKLGRGRFLYLSAPFDPYTPYGISRYPHIPFYLKNTLGASFRIRRNNLEFYFDPGLRQATLWEGLVKRWKAAGVKIVYVAGWHFYPKYRFLYPYFVKLCHSAGIAAYAWFEFPYVSPLFWEQHPQWREKSATLEDGRSSWRLSMNLINPEARKAVKEFMVEFLSAADWDGVNLAELHYDTNGPEDPARFLPFNDDVRREFKRRERVDPTLLFQPHSPYYYKKKPQLYGKFLLYRQELLTELHADFLQTLQEFQKNRGKPMETIVTVMDSLYHPEIPELCGIKTEEIVSLMDRFPFTLQVEDPARSWSGPPSRYAEYYKGYEKIVKDPSRLMFDINVVERSNIEGSHLTSPYALGTELGTTLYYAAAPSGRAGIYSESTVSPMDMDLLPFVMGSDVKMESHGQGFLFHAAKPFTLNVTDPELIPFINGDRWPFHSPRGISIPSGENLLTFKRDRSLNLSALETQISFEGDIYDLTAVGSLYGLRYSSPTPVAMSFTRPLEGIHVDGKSLSYSLEKETVLLPQGEHRLEILTQSAPSYAVDLVGYLSSWAFYTVGLLSVLLLAGLYLYARCKR